MLSKVSLCFMILLFLRFVNLPSFLWRLFVWKRTFAKGYGNACPISTRSKQPFFGNRSVANLVAASPNLVAVALVRAVKIAVCAVWNSFGVCLAVFFVLFVTFFFGQFYAFVKTKNLGIDFLYCLPIMVNIEHCSFYSQTKSKQNRQGRLL